MSSHLLPTTRLVAEAWLRLAVPGPGVGRELPPASDQLRAAGFLRVAVVGGGIDPDVPFRQPVLQVECWWPPPLRREWSHTIRAEQMANRLLAATFDRALMGRDINLTSVGTYGPARVHTVTALSEPDEVEEDESDWARFDLDVSVSWSALS